MRIGFFVDALSPSLTGIGRYCWELARGLPHDPRVGSISHFIGDRRVADPSALLRPGRRSPPWRRALKRLLRSGSPPAPAPSQFDVLHSPNYFLPEWVEQGIATVHDLSVFRYPETHPPERVRSFEEQFQRTLERAAHVIVDCETIRREVIEYTGFRADRVTAIPLGVSRSLQPVPAEERTPVLQKYGLPLDGYGLTLAALEPRKRIDRLIAAWERIPLPLRAKYPLVVAGAAGWKNDELRQQMDRASADGWLIQLGFVPEAELPAIYSGARLFAYPSLYEGFGLPPLEAMATGVPTIVAVQSCLPEVTKGAAMEIDPEDVPGFSLAIQRALEEEDWRVQAMTRGIEVARGYSWERCIKATVDTYAACAGAPSVQGLESAPRPEAD